MQKQAPSVGRIVVAVGFALSCFALLLFLWTTFGGPIPLAPKSYRFTADFTEATTLQKESDVRIAGVSVGKVKDVSLPPDGNATRATIEIDPAYAPISQDSHAILRQKTLLGETYVEITPGPADTPDTSGGSDSSASTALRAQTGNIDSLAGDNAKDPIPEDGHLNDTQVEESTQIDEVFNAFDQQTRDAFRLWQKNLAIAAAGQGQNLSDSLGNLGPFANDASDVLETLNRQNSALSQVVSSTGEVFGALTKRDDQLAGLIKGNDATFGALASRDKQLAEAIKILPTFNSEARQTLTRLESFSRNARPFARDLKPVARQLSPALADVRRLSPHLKSLFTNLGPLVDAAQTGFPGLRKTLTDLNPVMDGLDPFLANFNPILRYLNLYSGNVNDFLSNPEAGLAATVNPVPGQDRPVHFLRLISPINSEELAVYPTRLPTNRGNGYIGPNGIGDPNVVKYRSLFASHDCNNTGATGGLGGGQVTADPASNPPSQVGQFPLSILPIPGPTQAIAPCIIQPDLPASIGGGKVPYVPADP
jgi:phospholipid/cholesterol/gamma-HCH transport system substrate-binding protein